VANKVPPSPPQSSTPLPRTVQHPPLSLRPQHLSPAARPAQSPPHPRKLHRIRRRHDGSCQGLISAKAVDQWRDCRSDGLFSPGIGTPPGPKIVLRLARDTTEASEQLPRTAFRGSEVHFAETPTNRRAFHLTDQAERATFRYRVFRELASGAESLAVVLLKPLGRPISTPNDNVHYHSQDGLARNASAFQIRAGGSAFSR
jgi:hypothetical protein